MSSETQNLEIPFADRKTVCRVSLQKVMRGAFPLAFLAIEALVRHDGSPSWLLLLLQALFLALGLAAVIVWLSNFRRLNRNAFVRMDDAGLTWVWRGDLATMPWSRIAACASKNEDGRRILRFFLRGKAEAAPTARLPLVAGGPVPSRFRAPAGWRGEPPQSIARAQPSRFRAPIRLPPPKQAYLDIDFSLAREPEKSLNKAFAACAAWIAATRDPSAADNPTRAFEDS